MEEECSVWLRDCKPSNLCRIGVKNKSIFIGEDRWLIA